MKETVAQPKKSLLRKILKWTGIVFLLIVIMLLSVPFLFKGKIIAKAEEEMNQNMNAKVKLGEVDLTLFSSFPDLRLTMQNFYIANIDSFAGDTLISARKLLVDLNLMSVIKGAKYEINSIILENPRIMAKVLKSGKASWDITKPSTPSAAEQKSTSPSSFRMGLKNMEIRNGTIVYDDASLATKAIMEGMDFKMNGDFTADIFDVKLLSEIKEFTVLYGGVKYLNKVATRLNMKLGADMPKFKFTFKENEFTLNELVLGLDGFWAMPKSDMEMDLKLNTRKTDFKNILSLIPGAYTKDFANVKATGSLALDGFAKGIYGKKSMPAFGINLAVDNGTFQYPSFPKSASGIVVDLRVDNADGISDHTHINLKKFHVNLGDNFIDARALVITPVSDPDVNAILDAKLDLGSLHDVIPLQKTDELNGHVSADVHLEGRMSYIDKKQYDKFKASGKFNVEGMNYRTKGMPEVHLKTMTLDFTPQYVALTNLEALIGRSDIAMNGRIENFMQYAFKNDLLKGHFDFKSETMDLNQLMGSDTAKTAPASATAAAPMSVIAVPSNLDFSLEANIARLIYDKLNITQVKGLVRIANSTLEMEELKMNMLSGNMLLKGSYTTRDLKKPHVDFRTISISNFDIRQTFTAFNTVQKLAPIAGQAEGKFSTTLSFVSDLDKTMEPISTTLTGHGDLKTDKVAITNFAPLSKIADALKMEQFKKLDVSNLNLSYEFKNGRVFVAPFDLNSGTITAKVDGSTGFDQTIDYRMKMVIPTTNIPTQAKDALNGVFAKVNNIAGTKVAMGDKAKVTAILGGTATKPTIKIVPAGMEGSVKDNVKEDVKAIVGQTVDKAKAEARAQADKIMADAQVEAQRLRDEAAKASAKFKQDGYVAADDAVKQASNPIEKIVAKKAAEKAKQEVDVKAQTILDDGNKAAQKVLDEAKKKSDDLLK